ncbi:ribonuclease HI family protein [Staphylococcus borealis]|uniref:ribonuclease HI family protein n=1 Tax=Staphylococcus borealis TaxID=2742203 RepID=UPI0039EC0409
MAKIYFDAATKGNPGRSACGIVIKEEDKRYVYTHDLGELDNHSAEWATLIYALEHARELNVVNALLYTDSKLIEDSVNQGFVKNARFKPYFENLEILEESFDLLFVKWIPREQNKEANQIAQQTLFKLTKKKK